MAIYQTPFQRSRRISVPSAGNKLKRLKRSHHDGRRESPLLPSAGAEFGLLLYSGFQQFRAAGSGGGGIVFCGHKQIEALGRGYAFEFTFQMVSKLEFAEVLSGLSIGLDPDGHWIQMT